MSQLIIPDNQTVVLENTEYYDRVQLGAGASISAPEGKTISFVVDGVVCPQIPGAYDGAIACCVSEPQIVIDESMGKPQRIELVNAVFVEDGRIIPEKSALQALKAGVVTDIAADQVVLHSNTDGFGGFYITGKSSYRIKDADIQLCGKGYNDFVGSGAGITATGNSHLVLENCRIRNEGLSRCTLVALGHACVEVRNCDLEVLDGDPDVMGGAPWMLGISGKARCTNLLEYATIHYKNCRIKSQGWGCMSTDGTTYVNLDMEDCTIEATDSGYGCYSIGYSKAVFSNCSFRVPDIGLVMAVEGSAEYRRGSRVHSGRFGVMMHHLGASGTLTITEGSEIYGERTGILFKGRGGYVVVDGGYLKCGPEGLLMHSVDEDDPMAVGGPGNVPLPGGGNMSTTGKPIFPETTKYSGGTPDRELCLGDGPANHEIVAWFQNTQLCGDMIHTRTDRGEMKVQFENTTLRGCISTGVSKHEGPEPGPTYPRGVSSYDHKKCPRNDKYGLSVTLGSKSIWVITETAYISSLTISAGAQLIAESGKQVSMTVNGVETPIAEGAWNGAITLSVS